MEKIIKYIYCSHSLLLNLVNHSVSKVNVTLYVLGMDKTRNLRLDKWSKK